MNCKKVFSKRYKIFYMVLFFNLSLVSVGCSKEGISKLEVIAPIPNRPPSSGANDISWKQSEFILSSFFALPGSANATDYRTILNRTKAAGINRVELTFIPVEALEVALNVAEEVGIKTIAQDVEVFSGIGENGPEVNRQKIINRVNYLKRYTMLDGYFIWDEPFEKDFDKVVSINNILREVDSTRLAYSTIFPSYGVYNWESGAYNWDDNSYTRYVSGYMNKVNPDIFSYNYYPYRTNSLDANLFINDMWKDFGYIRKLVLERDKKLWVYIQAVNLISGQESIINVERIKAQMFAALAYGVKGISYYNTYGSLLNEVFEKTEMYDDLTIANNEVKNIGNVLLEKKAEKLYHTGSLITNQLRESYFLDNIADSELIKSAPDNLIIGVFPADNLNGKYVLISNKSHSSSVTGEVKLQTSKNIRHFNKGTKNEGVISESSNKFQINLLPGEGELYRLN